MISFLLGLSLLPLCLFRRSNSSCSVVSRQLRVVVRQFMGGNRLLSLVLSIFPHPRGDPGQHGKGHGGQYYASKQQLPLSLLRVLGFLALVEECHSRCEPGMVATGPGLVWLTTLLPVRGKAKLGITPKRDLSLLKPERGISQ